MNILKAIARALFRLLYRIKIKGLENYPQKAEKLLIIANHQSFLDALLLTAFLPHRLVFAIDTHISQKWWMRPVMALIEAFPMNPANPYSVRSMIHFLNQGNHAGIFPEGRITVTGSMMKIYPGPATVALRSGAQVLPVRLEGLQYTPFSRMKGKHRLRWFPKLCLTVFPPTRITVDESIRGRARREKAAQQIYNIMCEAQFSTSKHRSTLLESMLDAIDIHGPGHVVAEDLERQPLSYRNALLRAGVLSQLLNRNAPEATRIAIMLPNALGTMLSFVAAQILGKTPAMLNFSQGSNGMLNACRAANVSIVYTSRKFVRLGKLEETVARMEENLDIRYLEDLREDLRLSDKLYGLLISRLPRFVLRKRLRETQPRDPAVILFTSGSEGTPKGVVLSHQNLLANREQMLTRIDVSNRDLVLNSLPLFHSFGIMAGFLVPLTTGARVFFYPSPLHYRMVPEMAYITRATIVLGTNTFLAGYARFAHRYDFFNVRFAFTGAEKLQASTRQLWFEKFGVRIFEGYGATETSPALATNGPMSEKFNTVGRLLPHIDHYLKPVPGIEKGGQLVVKGPNVMLGYHKSDQPGVLQPPRTEAGEGWYDTGDIVDIDEEGFVQILDRAKRFAKIAGEMVSLGLAENLAASLWPHRSHAVITEADERKGEKLVLVTEEREANRKELLEHAKAQGITEIAVPRRIEHVRKLPRLGSGKIDYSQVTELIHRNA